MKFAFLVILCAATYSLADAAKPQPHPSEDIATLSLQAKEAAAAFEAAKKACLAKLEETDAYKDAVTARDAAEGAKLNATSPQEKLKAAGDYAHGNAFGPLYRSSKIISPPKFRSFPSKRDV